MIAKQTRGALTQNDLFSAATVACTAGVFTQLGAYQVQAGEMVSVGYGGQSGQENAQGRFYSKLQTSSPAEVAGIVRISILGPQNSVIRELGQWRTELLSASTDRTKQIPLPDFMIDATEDRKIILEFNPDSTATVTKADSTVTIDTTRSVLA